VTLTSEAFQYTEVAVKPEEQSIVIDRPVAEVFAFVTDQRNTPQWQAGLVEVQRLTDGAPRVGTQHALVRQFLGRRMEAKNEYLRFEPDRLVTFKTISGPAVEASYVFEPVAGGTRLTSRVLLRAAGPFAALLQPIMSASLRREMKAALPALKVLLEAKAH
jgi:uncharacterized protein YndB with AHSA1/START domain